jgi:hypothetical protein
VQRYEKMVIQSASQVELNAGNAWKLSVGSDMCRNVAAGLDHEWCVTNGLGGMLLAVGVGKVLPEAMSDTSPFLRQYFL